MDQNGFREYVLRFQKLFHTPAGVRTISAVGNHDIGFHYRYESYSSIIFTCARIVLLLYKFLTKPNHFFSCRRRLHPLLSERFDEAFNHSAVNLHTIRNVHFVTINSMAMENDGCYFCEGAKYKLRKIQCKRSEIL